MSNGFYLMYDATSGAITRTGMVGASLQDLVEAREGEVKVIPLSADALAAYRDPENHRFDLVSNSFQRSE